MKKLNLSNMIRVKRTKITRYCYLEIKGEHSTVFDNQYTTVYESYIKHKKDKLNRKHLKDFRLALYRLVDVFLRSRKVISFKIKTDIQDLDIQVKFEVVE